VSSDQESGSEEAFEAASRQLYRERPEEFVAARNRAVREARGRGQRELATRLAGLRRPNLSLWLANRLHEVAPHQLKNLLAVAGQMQAAQARAALGDVAARKRFRELITRGAVDIVQPDIAWAGGFSECRRIAALAQAHHRMIAPHAFASAVTLVASLIKARFAPDTAPPLESITVPRMRPPVLCAPACGAVHSIVSKSESTPRREAERKTKTESWDIVNPPLFLDAKDFNSVARFFEVAAFPKPYYNPANLVKVGTGVKQK